MDDSHFDVIIIGTALTESIAAAALSKAGLKVAHIDENPYYGGDDATLSLDEIVQWADKQSSNQESRFTSISRSLDIPSETRQYSICLSPSAIPSLGPLINSLVSSGVSKYSGFRLLDYIGVYSSGAFKPVPGSKEEVFKTKDIGLKDKRLLMRSLMYAVGDFEDDTEMIGKQNSPFVSFLQNTYNLNQELASVIAYSLAHCVSPSDPTLPALQRLRRYLRSTGRYGPSPFLIGHYGGIGDISQGFCRAAAVSGAVYILGRQITKITKSSPNDGADVPSVELPRYSIELEEFPNPITCNVLVSSALHTFPSLLSEAKQLAPSDAYASFEVDAVFRCIAIVDQPLVSRPGSQSSECEDTSESATPIAEVDTALLKFPPGSLLEGSTNSAATALITGEGTMSTPKGKWIVYIELPLVSSSSQESSPETTLKPYLNAICSMSKNSSPATPLFTLFYRERISRVPLSSSNTSSSAHAQSTCLIPASAVYSPLPDIPDMATVHAEDVFREVMEIMRPGEQPTLWPSPQVVDDDEDAD